jgi:DNA-binding response OmpR family regulator
VHPVTLVAGGEAAVQPAILVVDDEEEFLNTYRRLFERLGFRVVAAASCAAARAALALEPFALMIADLRLPDGDGLDIVRGARATARPTPTIVVSGFASNAARTAALEAGATEVFAKPFQAAALAARVRQLTQPPA